MSVYSDLKCAIDDDEKMFLKDLMKREARKDEYLYESSCDEYDDSDDDEDYEDE